MEHEKQQVIITIGREYGSGGHLIADMLGEKYGLPVYDSTIIEVIAKEKNLNLEKLKEYLVPEQEAGAGVNPERLPERTVGAELPVREKRMNSSGVFELSLGSGGEADCQTADDGGG